MNEIKTVFDKDTFEKLAGFNISYKTFEGLILPMRNAVLENCSDAAFCNMFSPKAFRNITGSELLADMKLAASKCRYAENGFDVESAFELRTLARKFVTLYYGRTASARIDLVGEDGFNPQSLTIYRLHFRKKILWFKRKPKEEILGKIML